MSDRTLLLHLGGKLAIASHVPLRTRDDLSMAYTPGVTRVSMAIAKDPSAVRNLTIKRNTVAVVTDGSTVLGLGNIGPEATLPPKPEGSVGSRATPAPSWNAAVVPRVKRYSPLIRV